MIIYNKSTNRKIVYYAVIFLGGYQILGGLFGLTLVFKSAPLYVLKNLIYFLFIVGIFIYSIICGIKLIQGKQLTQGIKHSLINQYLQIIQFEILGNGLYYVAGGYFGLGFSDTPNLHLISNFSIFESSCFVSFLTDSNEITLSINLVALIIIIFLNYVVNTETLTLSELKMESPMDKKF